MEDSVAYLGFQKKWGAKSSLAISDHTKGGKQCFLIFSYGEKTIFLPREPWPNGPPKYATKRASYIQENTQMSRK